VLDRAAKWLIECGYLDEMRYGHARGKLLVYFHRRVTKPKSVAKPRLMLSDARGASKDASESSAVDSLKLWFAGQRAVNLAEAEERALTSGFGSELERTIVSEEKSRGVSVLQGGRIRQEYLRRFMENEAAERAKLVGSV
jgi:hypothetical protein